jgi:hypothetical protein
MCKIRAAGFPCSCISGAIIVVEEFVYSLCNNVRGNHQLLNGMTLCCAVPCR